MPFDPSIPLQTQVPSLDTSLKPISSLLGIQGAVQQLRTGQLQQQQLASQVQERQNLSQIDWNQFKNPDGTFDAVTAGNAAMKASPAFFGPALAKQFTEAAKDQLTIKKGVQELSEAQRSDIGAGFGALAMKPDLTRGDIMDWASQYVDQNPNAGQMLITGLKHLPATDDPAALKQWLTIGRNSVLKPAEQKTNTTLINTGGQTLIGQNSPYQPGPLQQVGAVQNTITPGQGEEVQTDQLGNRFIVQRAPNGAILNTRPVPGSYNAAQPGAPGSGPANLPPGGKEQIGALSDEVNAAHAAANQAPVMHDINRTILQQLDKGVTTGMAGGVIARLKSAYGGVVPDFLGGKAAETGASDYDILGKMLERSALTAAQSMGPHTNAGLESQIRANGSTQYNPDALKTIAKLNDALTTGSELYRSGMQAAIDNAGGSVAAKRQFDQDWSKNFDVRVMRLHNAVEANDQGEIKSILNEVGGQGSKGANALMMKNQALERLTKTGHL
jgi:hypothetical protein